MGNWISLSQWEPQLHIYPGTPPKLSQDLTQSATNLRKDKSSGCRGRESGRASQWLILHRPCNKTGTKPQLDPVAMLNAISEYFAFIFCKQHQCMMQQKLKARR